MPELDILCQLSRPDTFYLTIFPTGQGKDEVKTKGRTQMNFEGGALLSLSFQHKQQLASHDADY